MTRNNNWGPFHGVDLETTYTGCFTIGGDKQYFETWWSYPAITGIDSVFKVITRLDKSPLFPLGERKMKIHYHYRDPKRKRSKTLTFGWDPMHPKNVEKHKYLSEVFGKSWKDAVRFHMKMYEQFWED
jgi:hypothetical protein